MEGGREGEREGGREGGREGRRERGKEEGGVMEKEGELYIKYKSYKQNIAFLVLREISRHACVYKYTYMIIHTYIHVQCVWHLCVVCVCVCVHVCLCVCVCVCVSVSCCPQTVQGKVK